MLDPLNLQRQLDELRLFKDGWYDGMGHAPSAEGLDWLGRAFDDHYPDNLGLPYIYPAVAGGVRLEWSFGPDDLSLEIDLREHAGHWHSLNLDTDDEEARLLKLDTRNDWNWLVGRLLASTEAEA